MSELVGDVAALDEIPREALDPAPKKLIRGKDLYVTVYASPGLVEICAAPVSLQPEGARILAELLLRAAMLAERAENRLMRREPPPKPFRRGTGK